jgi:hypothetical protein
MFILILDYLTTPELKIDFALTAYLLFACSRPGWGEGIFGKIDVLEARSARKIPPGAHHAMKLFDFCPILWS